MNDSASIVQEINRLHGETVQRAADSRLALRSAVETAWQAGRLLIDQKSKVRQKMGPCAWLLWLKKYFLGTPRTAQNYMRLAECSPQITDLETMSLRQTYLRLGIATEPKSKANRAPISKLPDHVRFAQKLVFALKHRVPLAQVSRDEREAYRQDLRQVYELLRPIFEGPHYNSR